MSVDYSPKGYVLENRTKAALAAVDAEKNGTSILAEYDKRAGRILTSKGEVVPPGTFWDFGAHAPRKVKGVAKDKKK